jgi:DNA-binding GntR family transcriptional regulator
MSGRRHHPLPPLAGEGRDGGTPRNGRSSLSSPHPNPPPHAGEGQESSAEIVPLARGAVPLGRAVAEALRRAIVTGRLEPGERLVEDRLSAELGVSRVPIREAIRTLLAEGLAVPTGRRGARVAELGPDLAEELVEVRATLEALNARLAARRHDPAIVAAIRGVLERGNAASRGGSAAELARLNAEFHDLLAEAGSNRVLKDVMRMLRDRTELVFRRNSTERAPEDWREHAAILAAIAEGEEELAELLAGRHVRRAARARLAAPEAAPRAGRAER